MMHIVSLEDTIFRQFGSDHEELLLSFRQVLSFNLDKIARLAHSEQNRFGYSSLQQMSPF